jgi:hypothetical protein
MIVHVDRTTPSVPYDIADAVEVWARERGRHARMEWSAFLGCPVIHFTRKADDPVLKAWQEGELESEPTESVMLNRWDERAGAYVPLDLGEYGAGGVVALLEEADTWSGRGRYESLQHAIRAAWDRNDARREEMKAAAFEAGQDGADRMRRTILGLPQVQVAADVKSNTASGAEA